MRSLIGGAALIGGSLTGAAVASLVFLGPTLGVSPFDDGGGSTTRIPRAFDLPSGLTGRADLSQRDQTGALVLPVAGGSATGGPTATLRLGGSDRIAGGTSAPGRVLGGTRTPIGNDGQQGLAGASIGRPLAGSTGGGGNTGAGAQAPAIQAPVTTPVTTPAGSTDAPPPTSSSGDDSSGSGSGSSSDAGSGDDSGIGGASTDDPTPVTPPAKNKGQANSTNVLAKKVGAWVAKKGGETSKGLANALKRHGVTVAVTTSVSTVSTGDSSTTSSTPDDAGTAAPEPAEGGEQGRGTGEEQAGGRNNGNGDKRGKRHGRWSDEGSDS